jgi:hypothetical protein
VGGLSTLEPPYHYGGSFLLNVIQAIQQQDNATGGPQDELRQYLKAGAEPTTDIIGWWGVSPIQLVCLTHLICPDQHQIPDTEEDGARLPCHPRFSHTI